MPPLFRDLHPTCARCRGVKCTADVTCDISKDWSMVQWKAFLKRRPYRGHRKKRPSGSALPPESPTPPPPPRLLRKLDALRSHLGRSPLLLRGMTARQKWRVSTALVLVSLPPAPLLSKGGGERRREGLGFCRCRRFCCFLPSGGGDSRIIAFSGVPCAR